jgi:DNA-binding NtrC family response regulator
MPDMDGISTLCALRSRRRELPAILMSGYAEETLPTTAERTQPFELLEKPFTYARLIEALRTAIKTS